MKEVILTNKEIANLENELQNYKNHRISQLKYYLGIIIIGALISGIFIYLNSGYRNEKFLFTLLGIMTVMLIPILIGFLISKKGINKLSSDLEKGKKLEGKSKIKKINFFNRTIRLVNGIKVFELNEYYKTFQTGDLIHFKVSPSNEYIFECKKI